MPDEETTGTPEEEVANLPDEQTNPTIRAVKDAAVPKKADGSISWGKLTAGWSKLTFAAGIVVALWQGFTWIDAKLDSIESSASKVRTISENLSAQDERITEHFNKLQKKLTLEFDGRDAQNVEIQRQIDAIRQEMRARHGIFMDGMAVANLPVRGVSPAQQEQVQETIRQVERARIRTHNARPREAPLANIDALK